MNDKKAKSEEEKNRQHFEDDGRTIISMKDIDSASPNLFGLSYFRSKRKHEKDIAADNGGDESKIVFTKEERRALTKAAWILGFKVAVSGTAILVLLFLVMHLIVYLWNR